MDEIFDGYSDEAVALATDDAAWASAMESLGTAQAVYNAVGEIVSTKRPTSLRSLVDEAARLRYSLGGQTKWAARTKDGTSFGTYTLSFTQEVPEQHRPTQKMLDGGEFLSWLHTDGEEYVWKFVEENLLSVAQMVFAAGEVPDGCDVVDEVVPAVPSTIRSGVLRIDRRAVARAFGDELPMAVAALMEGE